jgi:hypothetical protein
VDCVLAHNSAGGKGGAAALCCCSDSRFENLTVVDNEAKEGAAFSCSGSSLLLKRSIVAFHPGAAPISVGGWVAEAKMDSCDVFGNEGGDWVGAVDSLADQYGNVSLDPEFVDVQAGNLRLRETSPLRSRPGGQRMGARQ